MVADDNIDNFLRRGRWRCADRDPLPGDASRRGYVRLRLNGRTVLLMDAREVKECVVPFVNVANYLRNHGLSAPEVYDVDYDAGLALIEDFGDNDFYARLKMNPSEIKVFYEGAVDLLRAFHQMPHVPLIPPYDSDFLRKELGHFIDWYLPLNGLTCTDEMRVSFFASWTMPLDYLRDHSSYHVFVHKDFHGGNLMWLPDRLGNRRIGIIDFQNAKFGSSAYDLVSFLYDCRVHTDWGLRHSLLERFHKGSGNDDAFSTVCHILLVQRNIKILGDFARVYLADARPDYLRYLPNVWRLIGNSLGQPILADIKTWLDHYGILVTAADLYNFSLERDALRLFPPGLK